MNESEQSNLNGFLPGNEIYSILDNIKTGQNMPVRVVLLTKNFGRTFFSISETLNLNNLKISEMIRNEKFILWNLEVIPDLEEDLIECPNCKKSFKVDEGLRYALKNYLLESLDHNILFLISNADKGGYETLIKTFNHLYPIISRVFYRSSDLRLLFNSLVEKNIEIVGKKCVSKRLFANKKTIVTYKEDTIEGFFEEARKENLWIDSIEVLIKKLSIITFSRKGLILYLRPFNFNGFFNIVIQTIFTELILKRREDFKDKSRTIDNPLIIHPIKLVFDKEYFLEEANMKKLVQKLSSTYELAVLYLSKSLGHISIFDYSNGCGFDIFINSGNELVIVPQTQSTDVALESLVIKINDIFEELTK
jgi:hypothetical protein